MIVGFPGETEADFAATCRVVEEVGFSKLHVFRFSPRQGTPAADMPGQVSNRIAMQRAEQLGKLSHELQTRYLRSFWAIRCGSWSRCRSDRPGWMAGTSDRHAPVAVPGGREQIGRFVAAVAGRVENGWLWAREARVITSLASVASCEMRRCLSPHRSRPAGVGNSISDDIPTA